MRKWYKFSSVFLCTASILSACSTITTAVDPQVDCPLRDEPYSLSTPLIDIMLKPEAREVVSRYWGPVLDQAPESFLSTTAPSFAGILRLPNLAGMARLPMDSLAEMERDLLALAVTDADRSARCARYDTTAPDITVPKGNPRILLFEKMTGFRDGPAVEASRALFTSLADSNGWSLVVTDNGAVMTEKILSQFDVVIWNNNSGDLLTLSQREAFKRYIQTGGGYLGIHGAGGDPNYYWDWYADELLGTRFIGHPKEPQFNTTVVRMENNATGVGEGVAPDWELHEEWYSFKPNPRDQGYAIIATIDESRYAPTGHGNQDLRMGDHPIAWAHCVNDGRVFYSAIGHRPEVYAEAEYMKLLEQAVNWVAGKGRSICKNGQQQDTLGAAE